MAAPHTVQKEQEILRAKAIEAEMFELRRPDGRQAASLTTGPSGESLLSFRDQNGVARLVMGIDSQGTPSILFYGEKHDLRMSLSLDPRFHAPYARMFDANGEPQLNMSLHDRLGPSISVGSNKNSHIKLESLSERGPSINLTDEEGNPRIVLSIVEKGPVITLLDRNRSVRSEWRVLGDGSPSFILYDRTSKARLRLRADSEGKSSIQILDAMGNTTKEIAE